MNEKESKSNYLKLPHAFFRNGRIKIVDFRQHRFIESVVHESNVQTICAGHDFYKKLECKGL